MSRTNATQPARRPESARLSVFALAAVAALAACSDTEPTAPAPGAQDLSLTVSGCYGKTADLVASITSVGSVTVTAPANGWGSGYGTKQVPVAGYVKNVGTNCAGAFRVGGLQWTGNGGVVALTKFTPTTLIDAGGFTTASLAAGGVVSFRATITGYVATPSEGVGVALLADACNLKTEASLPSGTCRVAESVETNNRSAWSIVLAP